MSWNVDRELRQRVDQSYERLVSGLQEYGLYLEFNLVSVSRSFVHNFQHPEDPFCTCFAGPAGILLRVGVHIPDGEPPDHPTEAEVFCGVEEPERGTSLGSTGFRLSQKAMAGGWRLRSWTLNGPGGDFGNVRREILEQSDLRQEVSVVTRDRVPHILGRIARLYHKGR